MGPSLIRLWFLFYVTLHWFFLSVCAIIFCASVYIGLSTCVWNRYRRLVFENRNTEMAESINACEEFGFKVTFTEVVFSVSQFPAKVCTYLTREKYSYLRDCMWALGVAQHPCKWQKLKYLGFETLWFFYISYYLFCLQTLGRWRSIADENETNLRKLLDTWKRSFDCEYINPY